MRRPRLSKSGGGADDCVYRGKDSQPPLPPLSSRAAAVTSSSHAAMPAAPLPARARAAGSCAPPSTPPHCSHHAPCATGRSAPTAAATRRRHPPVVRGSVAPPWSSQHPRRRRARSRLAATGGVVAGAAGGPNPATGCHGARWAARFFSLLPRARRRGAGVAPPPMPQAAVSPSLRRTGSNLHTLQLCPSCRIERALAIAVSCTRAGTPFRLSTPPSFRLHC